MHRLDSCSINARVQAHATFGEPSKYSWKVEQFLAKKGETRTSIHESFVCFDLALPARKHGVPMRGDDERRLTRDCSASPCGIAVCTNLHRRRSHPAARGLSVTSSCQSRWGESLQRFSSQRTRMGPFYNVTTSDPGQRGVRFAWLIPIPLQVTNVSSLDASSSPTLMNICQSVSRNMLALPHS